MRTFFPFIMLSLMLAAPEAVARTTPRISAEGARLIRSSRGAAKFMVKGNMPGNFRVRHKEKVRPGTTAFIGKDAKGKDIWVVDHRSVYKPTSGAKDISRRLLDGFFCGACAGPKRNGPRMKVLAVKRSGEWNEPGAGTHSTLGALKSPLNDAKVDQFIVEVAGVRPVPHSSSLMHPANFKMVIHRSSIKAGKDFAEFTGHFLNPDKLRGPFPGTTDGALRVRARKNRDGTVGLEEYYITKGATEYLEPISRSVKPMSLGKSLFKLGRGMLEKTPPGAMFKPMADLGIKMGRSMADRAMHHTMGKTVFSQVARLHTGYWEDVMFKNLRE